MTIDISGDLKKFNQEKIARAEGTRLTTKFIVRAQRANNLQSLPSQLKTLSSEKMLELLTRMNGLLRNSPRQERAIDGETVQVQTGLVNDTAYLPPHPDDKEGLLKNTFEAVKQIRDKNDCALLSYLAIQVIHPFGDGNGRLGRLLYNLFSQDLPQLTQEKSQSQSLLSTLVPDRQEFCVKEDTLTRIMSAINQACVAREALPKERVEGVQRIYTGMTLGTVNFPPECTLSDQSKAKLTPILGQAAPVGWRFGDIAVAAFLERNSLQEKFSYNEIGGRKSLRFDVEALLGSLNEDQANEIIAIERTLKQRFVHHLIKIFSTPENYINGTTPLKNRFHEWTRAE